MLNNPYEKEVVSLRFQMGQNSQKEAVIASQ